jgi:hypothetical protein
MTEDHTGVMKQGNSELRMSLQRPQFH